MTTLRIAMLYTPLITAGGGERQFLEELQQLRARGHHVRALTFELREPALFSGRVSRSDISVLSRRGGWIGQVRTLRAELLRIQPDVLVSHTSPELTWLATRALGVPYVQYHNSPPFYIGEQANPYMASRRYRRAFPAIRDGAAGNEAFARAPQLSPSHEVSAELRAALKHRALRAANAIVVPSQRTARELRLLHGVDATVVRGCLPASLLDRADHGVEPSSVSTRTAAETGPVVLSVCRLEPVKRIDLLLRAFALVLRDVPDAKLIVAGTGSDEPRLRALASELEIDGCVRFAGYVPEDALWELYASAGVLAAPAMADFIIAPYEAMAMGCRVVWTTEIETDPAVERSGQVFVAPPEVDAFANAIVAALRAPPGARADLHGMTWEARGERLEDVVMKAAA